LIVLVIYLDSIIVILKRVVNILNSVEIHLNVEMNIISVLYETIKREQTNISVILREKA